MLDVVIVGGGPAGLSAALVLARARRHLALLDAGAPRNAVERELRGFLTRDGTHPGELRRIAHQELRGYGVAVQARRATEIRPGPRGFEVVTDQGAALQTRRVLLATGMIDELPPTPGLQRLWGSGVYHCPYCSGWEVQNRRIAVIMLDEKHVDFALLLRAWSLDVVAFTGGRFRLSPESRARLEAQAVQVETEGITEILGDASFGGLHLAGGRRVDADVLFVHPPQRQVDLVQRLGLRLDENGYVELDRKKQTSIPGIHAAGDLTTSAQTAIVAAAAGAQAAYLINFELGARQHLPPVQRT